MIVKLKTSIFEKHLIRILSFLTAFFLWFYVVNSEPVQIKRTFEVIVKSPSTLGVSSLSASKIEVTLKGARAFLKDYNFKENEIVLDLSKKNLQAESEYTHSLSEKDFILPFGVSITHFAPDIVTVNFDKLIRKKVVVRGSMQNDLSDDLQLVNSKISPSQVMLEGPRSVMKNISSIKTKYIDVSTLSGTGAMDVELIVPSENVAIVEDSNIVQFTYIIKPKKANLTLKKIGINFISKTPRFKASKNMVSLDVLAAEDKPISESDVHVFAEIPDGKKGKFEVRLRAELPEGVHLLNINPAVIDVNIY